MREFVKYSRLKQIALQVIIITILEWRYVLFLSFSLFCCSGTEQNHVQALATTLNNDEIVNLRDQFDTIDIDKNGSITLEEMRQVLRIFSHCFLFI